jgi:hypothetical protein
LFCIGFPLAGAVDFDSDEANMTYKSGEMLFNYQICNVTSTHFPCLTKFNDNSSVSERSRPYDYFLIDHKSHSLPLHLAPAISNSGPPKSSRFIVIWIIAQVIYKSAGIALLYGFYPAWTDPFSFLGGL